MTIRAVGLCLTCALLLLTSSVDGGRAVPPVAGLLARQAEQVAVARPIVREVADFEVFTGRVEAGATVELRARVTGELVKVGFKGGDRVKKGDLLFEIDPRTFKAELDRAEAEVERAEARLKRAAADLDRANRLVRNRAMSREELDVIVAAAGEARPAVTAAKASREVTALNLSFTRITAPIDGRISRPLVTEGNLVLGSNTPVTTITHLATIVSVDPVQVGFEVDERTHLRLARKRAEARAKREKEPSVSVHMGLADEEGFPHRGAVDAIDVTANPGTGTVRWHAQFPNHDDLLLAGLFARVRLGTGAPHKALLVAEEALRKDPKGASVVLVVNAKGVVERRAVTVGARHGSLREIRAGLDADDQVVVAGHAKAKLGSTPDVRKVDMPEKGESKKGARP
jgi:RND family efflux transporter MFP subunit